MGLRWEYWPSSTPHYPNGFSNYNPSTTRWSSQAWAASQRPGDPEPEKELRPASRRGVPPRSEDRARGGYGISYLVRNTTSTTSPSPRPTSSFRLILLSPLDPWPPALHRPSGATAIEWHYRQPTQSVVRLHTQGFAAGLCAVVEYGRARALPSNFSMELAFVGNHGVNVPTSNNININAAKFPAPGRGRPGEQAVRPDRRYEPTYNAHSYYDSCRPS